MTKTRPSIADHLVHAGRPDRVEGRLVNMPVELGSTMVFDTLSAFEEARDNRHASGTLYYGRYGNAASFALETALAALDGADRATLTSSGVSAVTLTLMTLAGAEDHVLVADNIYGNTRAFCTDTLSRQGVVPEFFDPMTGGGIADLFRPNTRAVIFESPGSGTFEVADIPAIARAARRAGVISIIDATWSTPVFCQPLALGVDVAVASGSKYLGGHSDCMIGTIASSGDLHHRIRRTVHSVGDKPGAQEVFLALRGLRTLEMRLKHADRSGREIAAWLADQPQVDRVLHPAFETCPGHANWARDFTGASGLFGVVFRTGSSEAVEAFVDALDCFGIGVSWGGFESLVLPVTPVRTVTSWDDPGSLVRFCIGFESPSLLKDDLANALPLLDGS